MKKLLLPLAVVFLAASCTLDYTTIINNSGETVEVTFRHTGLLTIPPRSAITAETTFNMRIVTYTPEEWVSVSQEWYLIIFEDREKFPIEVRNFLDVPAIVTIEGFTRPKTMSPLSIKENLTETNAGYVHTRNPRFSAVCEEGFPVIVTYDFDGKTFRVSIN